MMILRNLMILLLVCAVQAGYSQPRYSPAVRADRETQWMTDSLRATPQQAQKIHDISLAYNQQMDKASQLPGKKKIKEQQMLMNRKDAAMKKLLDKAQFQHYYKHEKMIRELEKKQNTGARKPM